MDWEIVIDIYIYIYIYTVCMCAKLLQLCPTQWASHVALMVKNLPTNEGDWRRGFAPWVRKISWCRKW